MKLIIKAGYLFYHGTHSQGEIVEVPDDEAADIVARSDGHIEAMAGEKAKPAPTKKAAPAEKAPAEAEVTLPEADAAAAVKK